MLPKTQRTRGLSALEKNLPRQNTNKLQSQHQQKQQIQQLLSWHLQQPESVKSQQHQWVSKGIQWSNSGQVFYILMFIYDFILMIFAFEGGRCEDSTEKWKRRRWHRGVSETFSNAIFHLHLRNKSNQFDQYQSEIINYRRCSEIGLILLWYLQ